MFGSVTLGSVIWGTLVSRIGIPEPCAVASFAGIISLPLSWWWKLQSSAALDLRPSMSWPNPLPSNELEHDRGRSWQLWSRLQKRVGEMAHLPGSFFEDPIHKGRFVETVLVGTWFEHLRQHQRLTRADRELQEIVNRFQFEGVPKVRHYIAVQ